jgi:hypothetical protein
MSAEEDGEDVVVEVEGAGEGEESAPAPDAAAEPPAEAEHSLARTEHLAYGLSLASVSAGRSAGALAGAGGAADGFDPSQVRGARAWRGRVRLAPRAGPGGVRGGRAGGGGRGGEAQRCVDVARGVRRRTASSAS